MTNTITELFYVQDHYEVRFSDGTDDYTAQYFARKGSITEEGIQEHVDAYMNNEQSGISGVQKVPVSVEPEPKSAEEIAYEALESEVSSLKNKKDELSKELDKAYNYVKELMALESSGLGDVTQIDTAKANLNIFIKANMSAFNETYTEYVTKREQL